MTTFIDSIHAEYLRYKKLAEAAISQLDDSQLSAAGPGSSNSIAIICWHIAGNLQSRFTDFLTADGEKPWRHREEEFHARAVTKDELLAKWRSGWDALETALGSLNDERLTATITIRGYPMTVLDALHRSIAHTTYHVGQIVYVAKALQGANWRYLSIPPGQSESYNHAPTLETAAAHQARLAERLEARGRFQVRWDGALMSFDDASNLDISAPRIRGAFQLKRGVFSSDRRFWDWFNQAKARRAQIVVSLIDAAGRPTRVWTFDSAFPVKVAGPDLNATGNDVAIETIEIAHDGLSVSNA